MGVVVTRLVFLAFLGLTGFIIYNALYLQEQRNAAVLPTGEGAERAVADRTDPRQATASAQARGGDHRPAAVAGEGGAPAARDRNSTRACRARLCARTGRWKIARRDEKGDRRLREGPRTARHRRASDDLLRHILLGEAVAPAASTGSVASSGADAPSLLPPASDDATVKQVQQILADLGYAPGPIDGAMGDETERAVSAFQRDRKIAQTGRITPELLREIKRVTGRDLAGSAQRALEGGR